MSQFGQLKNIYLMNQYTVYCYYEVISVIYNYIYVGAVIFT